MVHRLAVLRGIRREVGTAVTRKASATARAIARMLKGVPELFFGREEAPKSNVWSGPRIAMVGTVMC